MLLLFWLAFAFLLYMIAGYPIMLALAARSKPLRERGRYAKLPAVSVILPVFNGSAFLRRKLNTILGLDYPEQKLEVLVVSDGSTDDTDAIAAQYAHRGVRLLRIPHSGKAAAMNFGVAHTRGDILFFTDVRQRMEADSLRKMVNRFADGDVGGVCGELIIGEDGSEGLYWRYEKWIRRQLDRAGSLLVVTGCMFAMRRSLFVPLPEGLLVDDAFLPGNILLKGRRVVVEPEARAYDDAVSHRAEFARKVRTLAGLFQMVRLCPGLVLKPSMLGFHYFSYKLGRLLMPYALLCLAIAPLFLPARAGAIPALAQAVFYGFALADPVIPEGWQLKRASSPVAGFVVMMAAAFCAAVVFFVPSERLWKAPALPAAGAFVAKAGKGD